MATSEIFQALGDPTRREILAMLKERDMSAGEIAERFPLAKSTLSGHFNVLRHAGLVVSERNKTRVVYSLNLSAVEEAMAVLLGLAEKVRQKARRVRKPSGRVTLYARQLAN